MENTVSFTLVKFLVIQVLRSRMSTNLVVKLGIQIIASSLTMTLGIWGRNCKVTAVEIPQYKENVSNNIIYIVNNT